MKSLHHWAGTNDLEKQYARKGQVWSLRSSLHASLLLAVLVFSNLITFFLSTSFVNECSMSVLTSVYPGRTPARRRFFEDIDESHHPQNFSVFSLKPSEYTAPASKAVDDAWSALGVNYEPFLIPAEAASKFSLTKDHVYQISSASNADPHEGFVANMEALHQLHCVNLVRQALFFNHDYYSSHAHKHVGEAFHDDPKIVIGHVNHCIDMLRELIMCHAEVDVVPYRWLTRDGDTIPDFARAKRCRNFESARAWAEDHQAKLPGDNETVTPADVRLFGELENRTG